MFGIRTPLLVTLAAAGLALSGCTSTGTNSGGAASSKNVTPVNTSQASTPTAKAGAPTAPNTTAPGVPKATGPGAAKGFGSTASAGDVKLGAITVDAKLGTPSVVVTITNHSSKLSNYIVDLRITSADGKTQLDTAMVSAPRLSPGATATRAAHFTTTQKLPTGAKLAIIGIARLEA